jgi:AmmeMemoRadiSam system protein A
MMCPLPDVSAPLEPLQEFSREERVILLGLAHRAISATIDKSELSLEPPSAHLGEPRGVFTTLHHRGNLRGCVGYVFPTSPLYRTVAETAQAAAFQDSRFHGVTAEEVPELEISLSILSPLKPIRPEEVEIGKHGLLVNLEGRRGLLLPQVPLEYGWDCIQFLQQTCRKAGLPLNAWQSGAGLEAFTAEVFSDSN